MHNSNQSSGFLKSVDKLYDSCSPKKSTGSGKRQFLHAEVCVPLAKFIFWERQGYANPSQMKFQDTVEL